ncbi:MAG: trypsin-like peptidase domain-containing protein [Deltaproteobacteria bacterium]|jgi:hypothetical protein|nr:trypsin-like peptidase domain-containing protein [Deltaproteobacteria bacterium]
MKMKKKIPLVGAAFLAFLLAVLTPLWPGSLFAQEGGGSLSGQMSDYQEIRRQISRTMEAATVWVIVTNGHDLEGTGTGFSVAPGYIMTNAHVVGSRRPKGDVYLINSELSLTKAEVVGYLLDEDTGMDVGLRDFALLKYDVAGKASLPVLTFNLDVVKMDRIGAWGYPGVVTQFDQSSSSFKLRGGTLVDVKPAPVVFTDGTISTLVENENGGKSIIHTAPINRGNSGGPLVNGRGEVVGINTWVYSEDEFSTVNIAITSNDILDFLKHNGVEPKLASGQTHTASVRRPPVTRPDSRSGSRSGSREQEDRVRRVGGFSVKVPNNWSVMMQEEDCILLTDDEMETLMFLGMSSNEGLPITQVVKNYAEEMAAKEPAYLPDDDVWVMEGSLQEMDCVVFVAGDEAKDLHSVVLISGEFNNPGIADIIDSLVEH